MTRPLESALLWSLMLIGVGLDQAAAADPIVSASQLSMPEKLVEVPGVLEGKIVMLEMSQFPHESWPAVERRVNQELQSLGLETVRVSSQAHALQDRLVELRRSAAERRAVGSLRIIRKGEHQRVEIWLHDALTGKTVFRQLEIEDESPEPNAVSLVALRAVEVLHSSLIEVRMNEKLRRRAPPAVERFITQQEEARSPLPRWRAWVGPVVSVDLGDSRIGAVPLVQLGAGLRLLPWLNCDLEVDLPLLSTGIQDSRGSADIRVTRVIGLLSVEPWARSRWSPSVAFGAGLLALNASGTAGGDRYEGASEWATVAWLALRGALSVRLATRLRLVGALSIGVAVPGVLVRFAEEVVATVGQPWIAGQLGLEWRWSSF